MKKEYSAVPPSMAKMETYGFSWMDFVTAIPAPLFVATSYKSNGKANACLQSWSCFGGNDQGFYAILSSVNTRGHLYQTLKDTGVCVLNFPSADVYDRCSDTINNNGFDTDEIVASGLTAEPAKLINAPRIAECFLALECRVLWEKEIFLGGNHVLIALEVLHVAMDEAHTDESRQGRCGKTGYLYNLHYPVNPEGFDGRSHDYLAVLEKLRDMGEY
jgi:flavin reductase (DIM6/NTAB) family NADH-FMN oxidoreductase RutF